MSVDARLLGTFANRDPGHSHKARNDEEDEDHRERGGHVFGSTMVRYEQVCGKVRRDELVTKYNHVM